jgi:hypothetical protein
MPDDDFIFVKTKKRGRRNTDTNQKVLIATTSEGWECKISKENAVR